jgi:hypothetical protein
MSKTDIHEVVKGGNLARVKELLAANPSYSNSRTETGVTPLHYAAGLWAQRNRSRTESTWCKGTNIWSYNNFCSTLDNMKSSFIYFYFI